VSSGGSSESIGVRLRRLRREQGLSQRQIAGPGVSYAYISRIEKGERTPSFKALRLLARKLGVSPEYLETGREVGSSQERELRLADAELALRLGEDPSAVEPLLRHLHEEATADGDRAAALRAQIALGLAAGQAGQLEEAVAQIGQALTAPGRPSPAARPDAYVALGRYLSALGRAGQAVELFEQCLAELDADRPGDSTAQVRFTTYLSYALTDSGEYRRATAVLTDIIDEALALSDRYATVRLYWSLARLLGLQGHSAEALHYARNAIALLELTEDELHLARAHVLCALIEINRDELDEARQHLVQAELRFGPRPEPTDLAALRAEQARLALSLGDCEQATEYADEAIAIAGETAEVASAWWALAGARHRQSDYAAADSTYETATRLLSEQGRWLEAATACRAHAENARAAGRKQQTEHLLQEAERYASKADLIQPAHHRRAPKPNHRTEQRQ
jgi:transcriptional regulator with XRE-family HTH domain